MSKICPSYAKKCPDIPKISIIYAQDMLKICQKYAHEMFKICPRYARYESSGMLEEEEVDEKVSKYKAASEYL